MQIYSVAVISKCIQFLFICVISGQHIERSSKHLYSNVFIRAICVIRGWLY
jgi:hypothetical protein